MWQKRETHTEDNSKQQTCQPLINDVWHEVGSTDGGELNGTNGNYTVAPVTATLADERL